jgi:PAS domain S-box-containing protein
VEEQLILANSNLESKVQERTAELAANTEELRQTLDTSIELNESIRKNEEQLILLTDSLPVLISYIKTDQSYQFVNKSYAEWFGVGKERIIGRKIGDLLGKEGYEIAKYWIDQVLSGKRVQFEMPMNYHGEEKKDVLMTYVPQLYHKEVTGFYALGVDITERKQFISDLERKNKELVRINNELDNFIYTASHDLKSPVVNIEGLIYAMEKTLKRKLDENEQKLFSMIEVSCLRLKNTIGYLTDISKISKNFDEAEEVISIEKIIDNVKADLAKDIEEVNPIITTKLQVKEIKFVPANINSIFLNLLTNAIKYRAPDRRLEILITTKIERNEIVISIRDNGLGMTLDQQRKIFQLFKRMHRHVGGSGVGLYIVKRIVENAGGRVYVESRVNVGTTFTLYLERK